MLDEHRIEESFFISYVLQFFILEYVLKGENMFSPE